MPTAVMGIMHLKWKGAQKVSIMSVLILSIQKVILNS